MGQSREFVDYLVEQLAALGEITTSRLFGGIGLNYEGRMFAFVSKDTLYLKTDEVNRAEFEQAGLPRFRPNSTKREMPYFQAPAVAIDDRELLCLWARKGIDAAKRTAVKKSQR